MRRRPPMPYWRAVNMTLRRTGLVRNSIILFFSFQFISKFTSVQRYSSSCSTIIERFWEGGGDGASPHHLFPPFSHLYLLHYWIGTFATPTPFAMILAERRFVFPTMFRKVKSASAAEDNIMTEKERSGVGTDTDILSNLFYWSNWAYTWHKNIIIVLGRSN